MGKCIFFNEDLNVLKIKYLNILKINTETFLKVKQLDIFFENFQKNLL